MAEQKNNIEEIISSIMGDDVIKSGLAAMHDLLNNRPEYRHMMKRNDQDSSSVIESNNIEEIIEDDGFEEESDDIDLQIHNASIDFNRVQMEFEEKSKRGQSEYIYLNFVKHRELGSQNRSDVYKESLETQFEKIQRKLQIYKKEIGVPFEKFLQICFPMVRSVYYVSIPSFEREITHDYYCSCECIYNVVLRPEKTNMMSSIIPDELDIFLVGDLEFRNNIISFVVKGIDVIDINVEKFGELRVECAAACAFTKGERNLPDYGIQRSELYKPFLTRDTVVSMCENVYPIRHPEKAVKVFEDWSSYIKFRKYFLDIKSKRNEQLTNVEFIKGYSMSKKEYKKNPDIYKTYLLDNNENFITRDRVFLREANEYTEEIPMIKVEVVRKWAEIKNQMTNGERKITIFERDLRRFTNIQLGLSKTVRDVDKRDIIYLGERIAFEAKNIEPDCEDIIQFFDEELKNENLRIDSVFQKIISNMMKEYREKEKHRLDEEIEKMIKEYNQVLDEKFQFDIDNHTDKNIENRYNKKINEIKKKYAEQRKELEKKCRKQNKNSSESEKHKKDLASLIKLEESTEIQSIPLISWYEERNNTLKESYKNKCINESIKKLNKICTEKENLLKDKLAEEIQSRKNEAKVQLEEEREKEIRIRKEKDTKRHFYVYFKVEDSENINPNTLSGYKYLIYDERAEKAKIERQLKTLKSFYSGYVKNPFLASYLFVPEELTKVEKPVGEIEWFGKRLNDTQKEAVRKALASNSIFLLQGPPGTGKTEVIAELSAQYIQRGKKVLISSETHKAIDNVFDRLPKIPEIRPLRLMLSQSSKDTEYSPEKLVDNLYQNISTSLSNRIQTYENFNELKHNFNEKMQELKSKYNELLNKEKEVAELKNKKNELQKEVQKLDGIIEACRNERTPLEDELTQYTNILSYIDKGLFWEDIEKSDILLKIGEKLSNLLSKYDFFLQLDADSIKNICQIDLETIHDEFKEIGANSSSLNMTQQKAIIKAKMMALKDPDTDEVFDGKMEEYKKYQKQLKELKELMEKKKSETIDDTSFLVTRFISMDKLKDSSSRTKILQDFIDIKKEITNCINEETKELKDIKLQLINRVEEIEEKITNTREKKKSNQKAIEDINESPAYSEFTDKQRELRREITNFFRDFDIFEEYSANDYARAIEIMSEKWNDLQRNQEATERENKARVPMYKRIIEYLSDEEILEDDRYNYTKKLFDNANIFGMTCTSREYFSENSMDSLREYNLGDISIRNVGIDVVIIDEVSKCSFLELMIPVLYGKTVILVGDHRQLSPIYDLKHMKPNDFDDLDPEIIDYDINKKYQELYETCFFKSLFESVPDNYKIMLDKQYRCHSDIMDIFNHFYKSNGKGLSIGTSNQNDLKNHDLQIKRNGVTLIEPEAHIYFINCTEYESQLTPESTSIINMQEAKVTANLLELINKQFEVMIEDGIIRKDKKKDERKSVGVICTYRDQAKCIKKLIKHKKFLNFSQRKEEKFIVNTVDDFQGDERDIIIVSMVRNPKGGRSSSDFIRQFERINVALSRARCMLVIVGSMEYLANIAIDLPDINGNQQLNKTSFKIYREIIGTIQIKGKILQATDIIQEEEENNGK